MSAYLQGVSCTEQTRIRTELEDRFRKSLEGICLHCGEKKSADQFSWCMSSNPPYRDQQCRACRSSHKRKVRARGGAAPQAAHTPGTLTTKKRRAILKAIKSMAGCADCGSRAGLLEFDHLPRFVKHFTISEGVNNPSAYSDEALFVEVAKCEVVCTVCHLARTLDRRKRGIVVQILSAQSEAQA